MTAHGRLWGKGRRSRSARRGYAAFESPAAEAGALVTERPGDVRALVAERPCESGRPSCGRSPRRGGLDEPPSKAGAMLLARVSPLSD